MQISAEKIWNTAQEHLRVKLSRDTFNMWFAPLRACAMDGQQLTVETPNEFSEVWLKDNYLGLMQDAVAVAAGCKLQVRFKVTGMAPPAPAAPAATPAAMWAVPLSTEDAADASTAAPITVATAHASKPFAVSRKNTS